MSRQAKNGGEAPAGIFYHGSAVMGIKTLMPYSKAHNTIKKPVVYLTPNQTLALFYVWNRSYKFVTFNENEQGTVVYTEWYENQFSDLMKGLRGSIYECEKDSSIYPTHIAGVYNSDIPVNVSKETVVDDVFGEVQKESETAALFFVRGGRLMLKKKKKLSSAIWYARSIYNAF